VSTRPEKSHRRRAGIAVPILLVLGSALAIWGASGFESDLALPLVIAGTALLLISAVLLIVFNQLQGHVQSAARAWSLIDVQLARRHDLIPALQAVTATAFDHERDTLELTAEARGGVGTTPDAATIAQAEEEVRVQSAELRRLIAVIEDHPELRADATATRLQLELADTENRIAGTRTFYNESVTLLRNRRGTFPGVLVARFADPRRFALFGAAGFERTVPRISYDFGDSE